MSKAERLSRAIEKHEEKTGFLKKLKFWGARTETPMHIAGGDEPTPSIDEAVKELTPRDLVDPKTLLVAGIAWEHKWGEAPPPQITKKRQEIIDKGNKGQLTSEEEIKWYNTIATDTDGF